MTYQITETDIDAFTRGDCWALAREIGKRTGWAVEALGAYREEHLTGRTRDLNNLAWVHVVVRTPDGAYLDVNGLHDADSLIGDYAEMVDFNYDFEGDYYFFEPLRNTKDWDALSIRYRVYPQAPVAKVAASLITAYHTGTLN